MSISRTLSNAVTGLAAASRSAQLISTNVANATTEGYARREIVLSARLTGSEGAGVKVDGVQRIVDEVAIRERRLASSSMEETTSINDFRRTVFDAIGEPQDTSSLSARAAEVERAFLAATSAPESEARLTDVLNASRSLVGKLNDLTDSVQKTRQDAENQIALEVDFLNETLSQIGELNAQILRARRTDQDYPGLLDSQQKLVDDVSRLIPVQELQRDNGTIALYSSTGALLVDATASEFRFEATGLITADMTLGSGALSGLTLNGEQISSSGNFSPVAGGRIAGLFAVRDQYAPQVQSNLDAFARDLVERFEDPTLDPTLAVGDPGLFTDNGNALDPADIVGLAGRLSINVLVDPASGGAVSRLRDGIDAITLGPVGNATLLDAALDRLQQFRAPTGGTLSSADRSVATFASDILSSAGQELQQSNTTLVFEQSRFSGLNDSILADGVDTDQELQKLLLVEQAYAANARVVQVADDLIQLLLGI